VIGEGKFILPVARHDVEVNVHDGLSCRFAVVLEDVKAIARQRVLEMGGNFLHAGDNGGERIVRRIEKPRGVHLGDYEGVTLREGVDVEIRENKFILVYLEGRNFAIGYGAEHAVVFHGVNYTICAPTINHTLARRKFEKIVAGPSILLLSEIREPPVRCPWQWPCECSG